jgi:hypothetical protein
MLVVSEYCPEMKETGSGRPDEDNNAKTLANQLLRCIRRS